MESRNCFPSSERFLSASGLDEGEQIKLGCDMDKHCIADYDVIKPRNFVIMILSVKPSRTLQIEKSGF